jgi:hypothetical protein
MAEIASQELVQGVSQTVIARLDRAIQYAQAPSILSLPPLEY